MKVDIPQEALLESLKIVSRAVSGQNTLPVLGNILIRAQGKKVHFAATNLEVSISTSTEANVKNEGAITVPAKVLTAYTSLLGKDEDVHLAASSGTALEIKTKSSKTKIKGIAADEFPEIAKVEGGTKINLKSEDFHAAVSEVAFAAQENSSRPILSGVYVHGSGKEVAFAATDSYRLSEKILKVGSEVKALTCVIPVRAVLEADRLASHADEIELTVSDNQAMFKIDGTELTSRLIEGQFPDYKQIIPEKSGTKVEVNREAFELAVRRVSIFAKENNQHMKVEFQGDGNMLVYTDSTEIGEEKTTLEVEVKGDPNIIALNADYVLDILGALSEEETIRMELDGKLSPAVIKAPKSDDFTHLIMPLKM